MSESQGMKIALPEQSWVEYRVAGFGSRALAYLVDFCIRWIAVAGSLVAILYLYALLAPHDQFFSKLFRSLFSDSQSMGTAILAFIVALIFVVEWSYPIYFEVRREGVTPGKHLFGLRVVSEDGLPIGFQASALRTLLLTVDLMPVCGVVALLSMVVTKRSQRLGDLVAKTVVIYEGEAPRLSVVKREGEPVCSLPIKHYLVLEQYLQRRRTLRKDVAAALAHQLVAVLKPLLTDVPGVSGCPWADDNEALEWIYLHTHPQKEVLKGEREQSY